MKKFTWSFLLSATVSSDISLILIEAELNFSSSFSSQIVTMGKNEVGNLVIIFVSYICSLPSDIKFVSRMFFFVLDVDPSVFCLNFNFPTHKNGRKFVRVHDFEFFCLLDISNNKFVFKSWTESKVHKIPLICFDLCPYYRLCSGALKMIFCHCPFSYFVHLVHSIVLSVLLFISFFFFLLRMLIFFELITCSPAFFVVVAL